MGTCATKSRQSKDDAAAAAAPLPEPPSPTKVASAGAGDVMEVVESEKTEIELDKTEPDQHKDKSRSLNNLFKENEGKEETLNESRIVVMEIPEKNNEVEEKPSMVVETSTETIKSQES